MRPARAIWLTLLLSLLLVLAASCGDGDGDILDGDDEPAATAIATDVPDEEPTAAATPASATSAFESYHYTVELTVTVPASGAGSGGAISGLVEGDFVAPGSHAFTSRYEFAGIAGSSQVVIIGDDAWYRGAGDGPWTASSSRDPFVLEEISLTSADEGFLNDADFVQGLRTLESTPEEINGVQTRKYVIPREAVEALRGLLGAGFGEDLAGLETFEMTVWVEPESSGLVRAEFVATATEDFLEPGAPFELDPGSTIEVEMTINLTRINDPAIEIEPPI